MILRIPRFARRRRGAPTVLSAPTTLAVLLGMLGFGLLGCGASNQEGAPDATSSDRLTVVASTDVWASVVRAVAGDAVDIESIIDDPASDPHSYESSPADAAAVTQADLVVFNGGGYDEFIEQILARTPDKPTVEAFTLAGHSPAEEHPAQDGGAHEHSTGDTHEHSTDRGDTHEHGTNEHVWYDLPVVRHVAEQVAVELGQLIPAQAQRFTADAEAFGARIDELRAEVSTIAERHAGTPVAMTEPVAFHLIEAAGLDDRTPPEFTEAIEEETDPPAAAVAATRELFTQRQVRVLIYNPQTETPVTSQIRADAERAEIPVVSMTETLPLGTEYLAWMSGQIDALSTALR